MKHITSLLPHQRFVFGSNLAGIHGAGAALTARERFGAVLGAGIGPTGQCYAIPTKDRSLTPLRADQISQHVAAFLSYADHHPELEFLVTPVGTGYAGIPHQTMALMFLGAGTNVVIPPKWLEIQATHLLKRSKFGPDQYQ